MLVGFWRFPGLDTRLTSRVNDPWVLVALGKQPVRNLVGAEAAGARGRQLQDAGHKERAVPDRGRTGTAGDMS